MDIDQEFQDLVTTRTIEQCDDIESLKKLTLTLYRARSAAHAMCTQLLLAQLPRWRSYQSSPAPSAWIEAEAHRLQARYGLEPGRREAGRPDGT
jgi:hypothetical protein